MATHSSTLAWRIPWTEEPGGLQSQGSQRLRHDCDDFVHACTHALTSTYLAPTGWPGTAQGLGTQVSTAPSHGRFQA